MSITKASLIDLNGQELILDADADTSITADTDDQIDIKIAGSDSIRIKANEIENVSGSFTLDSASDIVLDADGGAIFFNDGGTEIGRLFNSASDLILKSAISDQDLKLQGNDGGSAVNALILDMSEAGKATFNAGIVVNESGGNNNTRFEGENVSSLLEIDASTDRIGIGTSAPARALTIHNEGDHLQLTTDETGDAAGNGVDLKVAASGMQFDILQYESAAIAFYTAGTERMNIGSSGGVTIPVADNSDVLHLKSTDSDANVGPVLLLNRVSSSAADGDDIGAIDFDGRNDAGQAVEYASIAASITDASDGTEDGSLNFRTILGGADTARINLNPVEMTVNEAGNDIDFRVESDAFTNMLTVNAGLDCVGIAHNGSTARLTCAQTSASNITGYFLNSASTIANSSSSILYLQTTGDSAIQDGYKIVTFADSDTVIGTISSAASSTNVAYNTSSDERLKENIVDMESQLDKVLAAKPRQFNWKKNGVTSQGFIAQELQEVFPEAVTVGGEDPTESPWSVDYGRVTPFLMKAIQELSEQIKTLEAKVNTLQGGE